MRRLRRRPVATLRRGFEPERPDQAGANERKQRQSTDQDDLVEWAGDGEQPGEDQDANWVGNPRVAGQELDEPEQSL